MSNQKEPMAFTPKALEFIALMITRLTHKYLISARDFGLVLSKELDFSSWAKVLSSFLRTAA